MNSSNEMKRCSECDSLLKKVKTSFSLFFNEGDVLIKNYPVFVCSHCGSVEISPIDRKRTVHFINEHKKRYFKNTF